MDPLILTNGGRGVRMECTDTSQRAVPLGDGDSFCVTNPSNVTIYLEIGDATVTATTAGYPILKGTKEDNLPLDSKTDYYDDLHFAAVCESGQTGALIVHRVFR